ncbi:hypothetical protein BDV93DRAFT_254178 [Ceratobasidium sp. AG-I]|nr:hypothetical protein BDV93DRAFT_254178 [Ceratobasidium sp. AG-I]
MELRLGLWPFASAHHLFIRDARFTAFPCPRFSAETQSRAIRAGPYLFQHIRSLPKSFHDHRVFAATRLPSCASFIIWRRPVFRLWLGQLASTHHHFIAAMALAEPLTTMRSLTFYEAMVSNSRIARFSHYHFIALFLIAACSLSFFETLVSDSLEQFIVILLIAKCFPRLPCHVPRA